MWREWGNIVALMCAGPRPGKGAVFQDITSKTRILTGSRIFAHFSSGFFRHAFISLQP